MFTFALALAVLHPVPTVPTPARAEALALAQERADETYLESSAKRVLFLAGGGTMRARSRQRADGVWEIARDGAWTQLPAGAVERTRLEDEVLAEYAAMRKEVGRDDVSLHRRVELAHWCERNGLVDECLGQLDLALRDTPGSTIVERHLDGFSERVRLRFGLPDPTLYASESERERHDAVRSALSTASRLPPALRYLAAKQLVDEAGAELVRAEAAIDVRRGGPMARTLAAELLGRLGPADESKVLLVRAVMDSSEDVRLACACALGRTSEPGFVLPLERALGSSNPQIQANAAQALGAIGMPQALPAIARAITAPSSGSGTPSGPRGYVFVGRQFAYVQDYDVEIATAASIADPQIGVLVEGSVLDVRVLATTIDRTIVRRYLARSAKQLLGRDIGKTPAEWDAWATGYLANLEEEAAKTPETPAGGE
ncbi:MAG: HEAT repeat domain-containing protein [Planctomycetota bacterium]